MHVLGVLLMIYVPAWIICGWGLGNGGLQRLETRGHLILMLLAAPMLAFVFLVVRAGEWCNEPLHSADKREIPPRVEAWEEQEQSQPRKAALDELRAER